MTTKLIQQCLQFGCPSHSDIREDCRNCGFFREEALRRKNIPLTEDEDGTRRKVIRRSECTE